MRRRSQAESDDDAESPQPLRASKRLRKADPAIPDGSQSPTPSDPTRLRFAQLQEQERAMSAIRNQQAQLLRQSERRLKASKTKSKSNKRPTSGSIDSPTPSRVNNGSSNSSSGQRRAEQRRQARIARRRGSLSPAMKVASRDRDESVPLPMLPLDSDDDEVVDVNHEAHDDGDNQSLEHRLRRVTLHSTSWRALKLRETSEPPRNVLDYGATEDLPAPFSRSLDLPLEAYDDKDAEHPISRLASVLMPSQLRSTDGLTGDSTITKRELEQHVDEILSTVEPRLKECHGRRVQHIVEATRRQITSYRAQIAALRMQALDMGGDFVAHAIPRAEQFCKVKLLEHTVLHVNERAQMKQLGDDTWTQAPRYTVGRGESAHSERMVVPEKVIALSRLAPMNRSTTCIGVRGTLPVDDDPILRVVPYFNEPNKADTPYSQFKGMEQVMSSTLSALDSELHEYMLRCVLNACKGDARVFSIFRERGMYTQPHADYIELQRRALRRRLNEKAGLPSSTGDRVSSVRRRLDASIPAARIRGTEAPVTTGAATDAMLYSYRKLLCRRCFVYNCQYHGIGQPRRQARVDPPQPNVRASLRCQLPLENIGVMLEDHHANPDIPSSDQNHIDIVTDAGGEDPPDADDALVNHEDHQHVDHDHEDHDDKAPGIRRSVRSLTAASTRASSMLEQQQGPKKHRKRSQGTRQRTGADGEDYFGLGSLYRAITEKRYAHLTSQDDACGVSCYKLSHAPSQAGKWTPVEIASIRFISDLVSEKPCVIAFLMGVERCAEIFAFQESNRVVDDENVTLLRELELMPRSGSNDHHHITTSVRGNTSEHLLRTRYQRMKDRGANHQYLPCNHAGSSCNSGDCSCMRRDHFCDRACSCPPDCANRFPGCRCERGECRTPACPCFFSNRECDPDICMSCGACDVPVIVADAARHAHKSNRQLGVCSNTNILRGRYRKVGIASSKTHGWGAFALEPLKAGDFIYEYTGELLSQDEAERRGNIYDRNLVSFLFDLNEDVVVDAARKGNKSKFANHSSATPNCFARIILVNGDHRIGLYAKTDIRAGEELFFDYGYHGVVPDWSQARIRSMGHASIVPSAPASVSDDQEDEESIVPIEPAEIETEENEVEAQDNLNVVEMDTVPNAEGSGSN